MDIVYRLGEATAIDVRAELADPPSYSTVRSLLAILERKGHLKHDKNGPRYSYRPSRARRKVARLAIERVVKTFFDGSAEKAVAALLDSADLKVSAEDLSRLEQMIRQARKEGIPGKETHRQ